MNFFRIIAIIIFFQASILQLSYSQQIEDSVKVYSWFDDKVGRENTNIFNGKEYIEQHVTINNKQKFLESILFLPGIVTYNNEPYYDLELKYNVYDDLLLVKNIRGDAIELHKNRIDSFNISGHSFKHVKDTLQSGISGFYELLLVTTKFELFKKHRKKIKKFLDKSFTYFEFTEDTPHYIISYNNTYYPLNNRKDMIKLFPEKATEIRKFYRSNKDLEKINKDHFMNQLLLSFYSGHPKLN